jgi:GT2 family glycosyltransferase
MKVVSPNDTEHLIAIIPRYYTDGVLDLYLYNEATQIETLVTPIYVTQNGILTLTFTFTFNENDKYQVKITDANGIIYRDKIFATSQDTQNFKATNDLYFYE